MSWLESIGLKSCKHCWHPYDEPPEVNETCEAKSKSLKPRNGDYRCCHCLEVRWWFKT